MLRTFALVVAAALVITSSSCKKTTPSGPVVVRVLRAQQLAEELSPAEAQFALSKPRLRSGTAITVEHKDDPTFVDLAKRLDAYEPDVVILFSPANIPEDPVVRNRLVLQKHRVARIRRSYLQQSREKNARRRRCTCVS